LLFSQIGYYLKGPLGEPPSQAQKSDVLYSEQVLWRKGEKKASS